MALRPLQDYAKIKLDDAGAFSAKTGDTATDGILVALPTTLTHYGFYSFAFERSLVSSPDEPGGLENLLAYWKGFVGKRVYWLALSEKGAILREDNGARYAYVKLTSLMAWSEAEEHAESILDSKGGSF